MSADRGAFPLFSNCTPTSVQCFVQLIRPTHPDVCHEKCEKGFGEIQGKVISRKTTCMLFAVKHGDWSPCDFKEALPIFEVIIARHFWQLFTPGLTGFKFFYPIKTVTTPHIQQRENMCANRTSVLGQKSLSRP